VPDTYMAHLAHVAPRQPTITQREPVSHPCTQFAPSRQQHTALHVPPQSCALHPRNSALVQRHLANNNQTACTGPPLQCRAIGGLVLRRRPRPNTNTPPIADDQLPATPLAEPNAVWQGWQVTEGGGTSSSRPRDASESHQAAWNAAHPFQQHFPTQMPATHHARPCALSQPCPDDLNSTTPQPMNVPAVNKVGRSRQGQLRGGGHAPPPLPPVMVLRDGPASSPRTTRCTCIVMVGAPGRTWQGVGQQTRHAATTPASSWGGVRCHQGMRARVTQVDSWTQVLRETFRRYRLSTTRQAPGRRNERKGHTHPALATVTAQCLSRQARGHCPLQHHPRACLTLHP
jgi:hypothetical protein